MKKTVGFALFTLLATGNNAMGAKEILEGDNLKDTITTLAKIQRSPVAYQKLKEALQEDYILPGNFDDQVGTERIETLLRDLLKPESDDKEAEPILDEKSLKTIIIAIVTQKFSPAGYQNLKERLLNHCSLPKNFDDRVGIGIIGDLLHNLDPQGNFKEAKPILEEKTLKAIVTAIATQEFSPAGYQKAKELIQAHYTLPKDFDHQVEDEKVLLAYQKFHLECWEGLHEQP